MHTALGVLSLALAAGLTWQAVRMIEAAGREPTNLARVTGLVDQACAIRLPRPTDATDDAARPASWCGAKRATDPNIGTAIEADLEAAMGRNDPVCLVETECLTCGAIREWEYWGGKGRHCPECGSTEGVAGEEEPHAFGEDDFNTSDQPLSPPATA